LRELVGVAGIEAHRVRIHVDLRIQGACTRRGQRGLGLSTVGQGVPGLAMQV
jgi:hypothetical protein